MQTKRIAARIARAVLREKRRPIILALSGELGSGKTTFIQGIARALGIRERVQSPTFVLMRTYPIPKQFHQLYHVHHFIHIDAYRIESAQEARRLGLREVFRDRDAVAVIEWADRIRRLLPPGAIWIRFRHGRNPRERTITLESRSMNHESRTRRRTHP